MAVLERSELDASSLSDLHAIADQLGLDGFRRLRKAELIDAILERSGADGGAEADGERGASAESAEAGGERGASAAPAEGPGEEADRSEPGRRTVRRRRPTRIRRGKTSADVQERDAEKQVAKEEPTQRPAERGARDESRDRSRETLASDRSGETLASDRSGETLASDRSGETLASDRSGETLASDRSRETRASGANPRFDQHPPFDQRVVEGVVELLGNGSAFLRVSPPEASDEDLYISAAQVRRCELVSGDRVSGPLRTPRQSERYPSLARVDTINGASAESVAEGTRYEDLAAAYPSERLELDAEDPTLKAIEWLTPIGRGSRVAIVGAARSGKTETLRRLLGALAGREGLEVMLVLSGVRPEEIAAWREGPVAPAAALDLAASADLQGQAVEHVVDTAKRVAARGGDVVVLVDSLDGLQPHAARRVLAGARNLAEGGSLTVIATAARPFGGESTVIALDVALTSTGRIPALALADSGTLRPELLVGEDGAEAITKARASALAG
jgi:transcription termination factor Rho